MSRKFEVRLERVIVVEIINDDVWKRVVDNVDNWQVTFYDLESAEDVAGHIGRMLVKGYKLTNLDGWADLKDSDVKWEDLWEDQYVEELPTD